MTSKDSIQIPLSITMMMLDETVWKRRKSRKQKRGRMRAIKKMNTEKGDREISLPFFMQEIKK